MTPKAQAFLDALVALCHTHEVYLCPSMYDALQIWDLPPEADPVDLEAVEDRTSVKAMQKPSGD